MARRAGEPEHDPTRREFFKVFGRQTIQNAGAVAGAASEIRRTSFAAARELLDMTEVAGGEAPTAVKVVTPPAMANAPQEDFRSPYRFTGTSVVVLDQRELPERVVTFECESATDVASALRSGAVTPGPVMGQVAAYAMALAAISAAERTDQSRDQLIGSAEGALKAARGEVHAVGVAVERMADKYDELANQGAGGAVIAERMSAEADKIALEATAGCAEIGRLWAELVVGDPIDLLVHGDGGPLTCGMVGMTTSGLQALVETGRRLHVWVTTGAPSDEGSRISAPQLIQLDIPHTVIPDSAVGWLLASRHVSAVILRADTVAANGDAVALLGSRAVALLAHHSDVPVVMLGQSSALDPTAHDTAHLVLDLRSAAELGSAGSARLEPPFDVVPAGLVNAYVSEGGVLRVQDWRAY